jgi:LL-diaminopimelate aminotransferase
MKINPFIAAMPSSYLFSDIAQRVNRYLGENPGKSVLRLGIGDVTRPLAPYVADAFANAARGMATVEGFRGYPPGDGEADLIEAINRHDYRSRGIHLDPDEIFISDGAKTDVSGLQELFSANTLVAFTDPVYPVYVDSNAMAGRLDEYVDGRWTRAVYLPTTAENGFMPPVPEKRVDVIYLCYPNNPTGTVLTKDQLKVFVDWARENEALIIYDAAYKAFIQGDEIPQSIYEVDGADEVAIECSSFSKTAGFTGVRCAYTVVPKKVKGRCGDKWVALNGLWRRRLGSKCNGVSYPVQMAAKAVFDEEGWRQVQETIAYYRGNAKVLLDTLKPTGLAVFGGEHAPYVWLKTPDNLSGWQFFDRLLNEVQVVGTPGEGFGPSGAGYFRLTAFSTLETTVEAAKRVASCI